jgi:hypothetical protein
MRSGTRYASAHADHIPVYSGLHHTTWYQTHEEQQWRQDMADPTQRTRLQSMGWQQEQSVTYRLNSDGFRGDAIGDCADLVCLGCSFTFGFGVPESQTWPSVLAQQLNIEHVNFGVCGAANDTLFRLARFWIPELKPNKVAILLTWPYRWEVCEYDHARADSFYMHRMGSQTADHINDPLLKTWILNDINHDINRERNVMAIKQICAESGCQAVFLDVTEYLDLDQNDLARDLLHPGPKWHAAMADRFFGQFGGN